MDKLKLWLISQDINDDYDTFDSAVVAAYTEEEARIIHPSSWNHPYKWDGENWIAANGRVGGKSEWTTPDWVSVRYIGDAHEDIEAGKVICSSFNAG